jgi:hypothetical protein
VPFYLKITRARLTRFVAARWRCAAASAISSLADLVFLRLPPHRRGKDKQYRYRHRRRIAHFQSTPNLHLASIRASGARRITTVDKLAGFSGIVTCLHFFPYMQI